MEYQDLLDTLLEKSNGENDLTYEEICDSFGLSISPTTLRKSWNSVCGGRAVYQYLTDKMDNPTETEEEIKRLQDIKRDLVKERTRLQDQRRIVNKDIREEARFENLKDAMLDAIGELEPIVWNDVDYKNDEEKFAMLDLSDIHFGAKIDNVLNYYDSDVAKERLNVLLQRTIDRIEKEDVRNIYVNLLGDLCHGYIHLQTRIEAEQDVITQIIKCSEVLSNFLFELSKHANVKVHGVIGNHSSCHSKKEERTNAENFERMIFEYIQLRCPNIKVCLNGLEDWQLYKIGDRKFFISHGDKDSISSAKQHAIDLTHEIPDEIHIGHLHHVNIINDNDTIVVVNGSVMGTDGFSMSIRKSVKPCQVLRIYNGEDVSTYEVILDK